jgi:hypothetical protein
MSMILQSVHIVSASLKKDKESRMSSIILIISLIETLTTQYMKKISWIKILRLHCITVVKDRTINFVYSFNSWWTFNDDSLNMCTRFNEHFKFIEHSLCEEM